MDLCPTQRKGGSQAGGEAGVLWWKKLVIWGKDVLGAAEDEAWGG